MRVPLIRAIQNRTAVVAAAPSAVRGAGGRGVVHASRQFLAQLNLRAFSHTTERGFRRRLDIETENLRRALPSQGRSWGGARKVLNIFVLNAFYNHFLRTRYSLSKSAAWLEVPLDSLVAQGLHAYPNGPVLPRWPGVKYLDPTISTPISGPRGA